MQRPIAVVLACMSPFTFVATARAAGEWQPETLASGSVPGYVSSVDVAVGADGHAAVAWANTESGFDSRVYLKRRTPTGVWGPIERVSSPYAAAPNQSTYNGADRPSVAVDATGNTLVSWVAGGGPGGSRFMAAYAPVGQPLGAQQAFASDANGGSGAAHTDVGFGPSGEALITWLEVDYHFHSIVRAPDGTFGAETVIPNDPTRSVEYQDISYGRDGSAVLAWSQEVPVGTDYVNRAYASVRRPGGAWSSPQVLAEDPHGSDHYTYDVQAAVARDGSAMVAFNNFTSTGRLPLRVSALSKDGSVFSAPQPLPAVDARMRMSEATADTPGRLTLIGEGGTYGAERPVVADVTADGAVVSIVDIGDPGLSPGPGPWVAASYDAGGGLHLLWNAYNTLDPDQSGPYHVFRSYRPVDGPFGGVTNTTVGRGWLSDLTLAAGTAGDAIAAWSAGSTWHDRQLLLSGFVPEASPAPSPTAPAPAPQTTPTPRPPTTPVVAPEPEPTSTSAPATSTQSAPAPAANVEPSPVPTPTPSPATASTSEVAKPALTAVGALRLSQEPSKSQGLTVGVRAVGCTIPAVRGDTLPQARRSLKRAHCGIGEVRYVSGGRPGRIVRQNTPGAVRAQGFAVVLVITRRTR